MQTQVTTHRIPNLISNMCAYDFCSLIACSRFARFFCSMQLLYMSLQFGRFHAMLKNGLGRCRKRNGHQSMTNGCINKIAQIHCWKIWSLRVLSLVVVFSFITTWIHHGRTSVQTSIVRTGATLRFLTCAPYGKCTLWRVMMGHLSFVFWTGCQDQITLNMGDIHQIDAKHAVECETQLLESKGLIVKSSFLQRVWCLHLFFDVWRYVVDACFQC